MYMHACVHTYSDIISFDFQAPFMPVCLLDLSSIKAL